MSELELKRESITPKSVEIYQQSCGKINPVKIAEALGQTLHSGQKELASYFLAENRNKWNIYIALCSRRWGKSFVADDVAIAELFTPYSRVGIITYGLDRAKEHFNEILLGLNTLFPDANTDRKQKKKHKVSIFSLQQDGKIEIVIDGISSFLYIASEGSFNTRIVGKALTLLILDEFWLLNANEQQEVINKIIPTQATIGAYKEKHNGATIKYGKVAIFSTPRNPKLATPAGRMFAKAEHPNEFPEYIYSKYDADSNPLITPEVLEADRQLMTEADFMQEYYLIFPDEGTRVLRSFKESKHIINVDNLETLKNRDDLYMVIGTDYGQSDGNAYSIALYDEIRDCYYFTKGTYAKNRLTRDMYSELQKDIQILQSKFNVATENIIYFGDPSAPELLKLAYIDFNMHIFKAKNDRKEGFDRLNERFEGNPKYGSTIYIDESCKEMIRQWSFAQFKQINGTVTVNYARDILETHFEFIDTARYTVYSFDKFIRKTKIIVA